MVSFGKPCCVCQCSMRVRACVVAISFQHAAGLQGLTHVCAHTSNTLTDCLVMRNTCCWYSKPQLLPKTPQQSYNAACCDSAKPPHRKAAEQHRALLAHKHRSHAHSIRWIAAACTTPPSVCSQRLRYAARTTAAPDSLTRPQRRLLCQPPAARQQSRRPPPALTAGPAVCWGA